MKCKHLKLIMELIFIFILPLVFICFTSKIEVQRNFEYDNNGNYETSEDTKKLSFDNSIIKYTDGYKNVIENFNLFNEIWESGVIGQNDGLLYPNESYKRSKDYIEVIQLNDYYFYQNTNYWLNVYYYDSNYDFLSFSEYKGSNIRTMPQNTTYIKFYTDNYANLVCVNESISWANGNYVPYGEPLIIYSETDISGQNNINYTIWGNIKQLLIDNLDLNDNILIDIIICYTIMWFIQFIIWHMLYLFFDMLIHIGIDWGHKEREKVS